MRKGLSLLFAALLSFAAAGAVAKYNATGESAQAEPEQPETVFIGNCPPICA